jgi:hypothetical protein
VQVRGKGLAGASAAWFPCDDLHASVERVEEIPAEPPAKTPPAKTPPEKSPAAKTPKEPEYRVSLSVMASPGAALGFHALRLITPLGLSNAMPLEVVAEPVVAEQTAAHQSPEDAQPLQWPAVVNGTISKKGEVDFYSFDVPAGQELSFQAVSDFPQDVSYRAQAELLLYELSGSWFDPHRATLLPVDGPALSWEPLNPLRRVDFAAEFVLFPGLRHRFKRGGRYLVSVGTFEGRGGKDYTYQLRIAPAGRPLGLSAHPDPADWAERDSATMRQFGNFVRRIGSDRLRELAARAAMAPGDKEFGATIAEVREQEPNDTVEQAQQVTVPTILTGTIDRPGDVDLFQIQVEPGARLAFEFETPKAHPPRFNPWLKVRDAEGRELITNIFQEYGGDGIEINKTLERKTVHTFEHGGTYTVEVRNLTAREGAGDFAYRLLVRPQIPHLGRIELSLGISVQGSQVVDLSDHLNLRPGEARKLTVLCEKEEGFDGDVALTAANLLSGVEVFPSTPAGWVEPLLRGMQYRPLGIQPMDPEHHRPRREVVTILIAARADAPVTQQPQILELTAVPVVDGRRGAPLPAGSVPIMVIRP